MNEYEEAVRGALPLLLLEPQPATGRLFNASLRLEVQRLNLKLTPAERDTILFNLGISQELSPLSFMFQRQERIECMLLLLSLLVSFFFKKIIISSLPFPHSHHYLCYA